LRYVNTAFRHYPIVLSAPAAAVKARWVSNGSAVNARADKKPMWKEVGFPVHFQVGEPARPFGEDLEQLDGPHYAGGYLPIVQTAYTQGKVVYEQEAFAGVREPWAAKGTVLLRFRTRRDTGVIRAPIDLDMAVTASDGIVRDGIGRGLVLFDTGWKWDGAKKELTARLAPGSSVVLAVLTQP